MVDHERDRKVLEESSELRNHQDLIKISLGLLKELSPKAEEAKKS